MTTANRVVVLGGMGKTGRRVFEKLQAKGVAVRALSRSTAPAFDWEKPDTWTAALQNADAVYAAFQPDLVFLDVEMPHQNGFDFLQLPNNPDFDVIFITAHNQYAVQAIEYASVTRHDVSAVFYTGNSFEFRFN